MTAVATVELAALEKLGEINAFAQYMTYPTLYQKHLIPDDVLTVLNARWSSERAVIPNVEFHLAKNVYILDEGLVFTADGALISATRVNFSDDEVAQARATLAAALANEQPIQRAGRAILCKKRGASNYGHWLVEMLPKAYWAMRKLNAWDWPVVVHKNNAEMQRVVRQSLAVLGVANEKIIETGHELVHFDELLLVNGLTSHAVFLSPLVMECMEFIAGKAKPGKTDAIYAVRSPARIRDFEDEPAARGLFQRHGYTPVETASLSFLEQVGVFKSARRVVGAMGAALTNIIFCRPGTEVVMFTPASALELFFWHIAEGRKLDYHEVRTEEAGEQIGSLPWNRSVRISPAALDDILGKLIARREMPSLPLIPTSPLSRLSRERACTIPWGLSFQNNRDQVFTIHLNPDGTTGGYRQRNENSWRFNAGAVELLNTNGQLSWRFDDVGISGGKLHLRARCQLAELSGMLAYLDELTPAEAAMFGG